MPPIPDPVAHWQSLLASQPTNDLARFSLAKALFDGGRHQEAIVHLSTALEHKPDWMVVQILVGRCHLALGDTAAAREAFGRARQMAIDQDHQGPRAEMEQLLSELT